MLSNFDFLTTNFNKNSTNKNNTANVADNNNSGLFTDNMNNSIKGINKIFLINFYHLIISFKF